MLRTVCLGLLWLFTSSLAFGQDLPLSGVLIEGQNWELVSEGHQFTEGPAVDATGQVYFTDIPASKIFKIDLEGRVSLFVENSQKTNGLMFGPGGKLFGCAGGARQIVAYDTAGKPEVIADEVDSNDLVVTRKGAIFFTDPAGGRVWYISPQREKRVVAEGIKPNGLILTPDEGSLVVTESQSPILWTYRVELDGSLTAKEPYYGPLRLANGQPGPGSDGMTVDTVGRLYVTTRVGLQMFDPTGRMGGVIHKPLADRPLSNVCFGGPKLNILYVTAGDKVFRRQTQATGVAYTPAAN